jgi:uncharacterized SAM-dependent methyltransferase
MKTRGFSRLTFEELPDGTCRLYVFAPGALGVNIEMSPDELEIFLTDVINAMHKGRLVKVANRIKKDLEREQKKL